MAMQNVKCVVVGDGAVGKTRYVAAPPSPLAGAPRHRLLRGRCAQYLSSALYLCSRALCRCAVCFEIFARSGGWALCGGGGGASLAAVGPREAKEGVFCRLSWLVNFWSL